MSHKSKDGEELGYLKNTEKCKERKTVANHVKYTTYNHKLTW
jgi:hypothetical protein